MIPLTAEECRLRTAQTLAIVDRMDFESPLEERAAHLAAAAHALQQRKYTFEPYIVHPREVALIVRGAPGHTPEMLAAAWLHDVKEDTDVDIDGFPAEVVELVDWLTTKKQPGERRVERKQRERDRLRQAPAAAHTVKLADILSNGVSIRKHDPDFGPRYCREARALWDVLDRGDWGLRLRAKMVIAESHEKRERE